MSYECEDCGETFGTLTKLRLHDCPGSVSSESLEADSKRSDQGATEKDQTATESDLNAFLDRADSGELDILPETVANYESALQAAHEDSGDRYRDVFWEYYVPLANHLDRYARAEEWTVLGDIVEAYDPRYSDEVPLASPVVENAVGRYVIRTRLAEGVSTISTAALDYIRVVVRNAPEYADVTFEEAHPYCWGIGHPDHAVADHLYEMVHEQKFWVKSALEHAFYADQHAAVELLDRFVRDDAVDFSLSTMQGSVGSSRFFLDSVVGPDSDKYWPQIPRGWEWQEDLEYTFEWDSDVERRIYELVRESDVEDDLPADWTLQDLAV